MKLTDFLLVLALGAFASTACADTAAAPANPFLAPLFTDNMVMQQGMQDPVWGWTTPGATVKVSFDGKSASATAAPDGEWQAVLPRLKAGGPYTMQVSGPQSITLHNVLVGVVWLCSGQSNMEFGIGNENNHDIEIAQANFPEIRLFTEAKTASVSPLTSAAGVWQPCTPQSVVSQGTWNGFSAVAYHFGRDLYERLHVPVGLVQSSWGGTPAEAWTSEQALSENMPDFEARIAALDVERANEAGSTPAASPIKDNPNYAAELFNGMINPLIPFAINGVIWYQGESNADRAFQYGALLPALINDWRDRWNEGPFPFYIVQLANFQAVAADPVDSNWAELRDAQLQTANAEENSGIAVTIDIGDAADIHPKNKQEVGRRLSLIALAKLYGQKIEYTGPTYAGMKIDGNTIKVRFKHAGDALVVKNGGLAHSFAIAGADRKWCWADAVVEGTSVDVSSPQVRQPVAVRYSWATDPPAANLFNSDNLPASPFRTDDWPASTLFNK